jgi:hypothetical protein
MVIVDARGSQRSRPRNVAPRLVLEVQGVGYMGVHGHQHDAERTLRRKRTRRCQLTEEARASLCPCAGAWRQGFHGDSVSVSIAVPGQGRDDRLRDVTVIEPCDIRGAGCSTTDVNPYRRSSTLRRSVARSLFTIMPLRRVPAEMSTWSTRLEQFAHYRKG